MRWVVGGEEGGGYSTAIGTLSGRSTSGSSYGPYTQYTYVPTARVSV